MAIISCPECGKEISDQAEKCIHCGYPLKPERKGKKPKLVIGLVIAVAVLLGIVVLLIFKPKSNDSNICRVDDCNNEVYSNGFCIDHYRKPTDNVIDISGAGNNSDTQQNNTENEQKLNDKQEYIDKYIVLKDYLVEECEGYSGTTPGIHSVSITNNGDKDITDLSLGLDFLDDNGNPIFSDKIKVIGGIYSSDDIKAGYSWKMEDDKFFEIKDVPDEVNLSKVKVYVSDVSLSEPVTASNKSQEEIYIEQFIEVSGSVGIKNGYKGKVPGISNISIKNNGDRDIQKLTVTVYFQNESGKNIAEDSFLVIGGIWGGDTLKANYSWKMSDDKFYEFEHLADEVDISRYTVAVSSIEFE